MTAHPHLEGLMPCPFCGGPANFKHDTVSRTCWVACSRMDCAGEWCNEKDAAEFWNTRALAALPGGGVACLWTYDEDDYSWDSACGEKYCFTEGGPADNGHKFCHGCGNPLALSPTPNPHEADQ